MTVRSFFVAPDGRVRWGWRLVLFVLACAAAFFALGALGFPLLRYLPLNDRGRLLLLQAWLLFVAALAGHAIMLRTVERRGWQWIGLGRAALGGRALLRGAAIGALAIGVPSGLLLAARLLRVEPGGAGSWGATALSFVALLAPAALFEELAFRGYPFAVLRERFGAKTALVVTSVVFGLVHVQNPGAGPLPLAMVVVAGFLLGAVLLVTQSLYAAWAAHFAWNWTMAAVFHMAVSGGDYFSTPGYRVVETGPDWLTGGNWGPEGGLGAFAGMATALWYLTYLGRRGARERAVTGNTAPAMEHTSARQPGREESSA